MGIVQNAQAQTNFTQNYEGFASDPYQDTRLLLLDETNLSSIDIRNRAYYISSEEGQNITPQRLAVLFQQNPALFQPAQQPAALMKGESLYVAMLVSSQIPSKEWVVNFNDGVFAPKADFERINLWNGITGQPIPLMRNQEGINPISFFLPSRTPYLLIFELKNLTSPYAYISPSLAAGMYAGQPKIDSVILFGLLAAAAFLAFVLGTTNAIKFRTAYISFLALGSLSLGTSAYYAFFMAADSIPDALVFLTLWLLLASVCSSLIVKRDVFSSALIATSYTASGFALLSFLGAMTMFLGIIVPYMSLIIFVFLGIAILLACISSASAYFMESAPSPLIPAAWFTLLLGVIVTWIVVLGVLPAHDLSAYSFAVSVIVFQVLFSLFSNTPPEVIDEDTNFKAFKKSKEISPVQEKIIEAKQGFDQKRLLQVLQRERQIMKDLQAKDARQVEAMRNASIEADRANAAKSAFLAMISHEIRTPMTGILGMVRFLNKTQLSTTQKDYVDTISESGNAMMSLLNDILDIEKMDSGKMELEIIDFDLHKLLKTIHSLMQGHAQNKNTILELNIGSRVPRVVKGDPTRLRQVMINLTSNAIKFTDEGTVTISTKITENADNTPNSRETALYFAVEDSGIGIPKEAQKNLFNPFIQAEKNTTRKYGGTGLGLAICQKLINLMGGHININSTPGQGSIFFFTISLGLGNEALVESAEETSQDSVSVNEKAPLVENSFSQSDTPKKEMIPPHTEQEKPAKKISDVKKSMKALVVDDNAINRKVISGLVEEQGFEASTASSAAEAIQKLTSGHTLPDVIFMDIEMPQMDGLTATKKIRSLDKEDIRKLPIVALTGNTGDDDVQNYKNVGMNDFVPKPVDVDTLAKVLEKARNAEYKNQDISPNAEDVRHTNRIGTDTKGTQPLSDASPIIDMTNKTSTPIVTTQPELADEVSSTKKINSPKETDIDSGLTFDADSSGLSFDEGEAQTDDSAGEAVKSIGDKDTLAAGDNLGYKPEDYDFAQLSALKTSLPNSEMSALISEFTDKMNEIFTHIQEATRTGSKETIAAKTHELKGMCANFGLTRIASECTNIEQALRVEVAPFTEAVLSPLNTKIQEAEKALADWVK